MLRVGPWNRLPLTIRWLAHDFIREFPVNEYLAYQFKMSAINKVLFVVVGGKISSNSYANLSWACDC